MYLLDTNIFLEVLLNQDKSNVCKTFISTNIEEIYISDFSLHSIGVILVSNKRPDIFEAFLKDIIQNIEILSLPTESYKTLAVDSGKFNLDFDDLYQYNIAKKFKLKIVTMDSDFKKISKVDVLFL